MHIFVAGGEVASACLSAVVGQVRPYIGCVLCQAHAAYVTRCVDEGLLIDARGDAKLCASLFADKATTSVIANVYLDILIKIKIHWHDCIQGGSDSEVDENEKS